MGVLFKYSVFTGHCLVIVEIFVAKALLVVDFHAQAAFGDISFVEEGAVVDGKVFAFMIVFCYLVLCLGILSEIHNIKTKYISLALNCLPQSFS